MTNDVRPLLKQKLSSLLHTRIYTHVCGLIVYDLFDTYSRYEAFTNEECSFQYLLDCNNSPDSVLLFDDCVNPLNDHTEPFKPLEPKNRLRFGGTGQPANKIRGRC